MEKTYRILSVNPGSTSTKVAVFENEKQVFLKNISHEAEQLKEFKDVQNQLDYRKEMVEKVLKEAEIDLKSIDIFVGRGGGLVSVAGGTYLINDRLLQDAAIGMAGQHPAQLASQICNKFVQEYGGRAYIVNPPDTDEFDEIARITGLKGVYRESRIHTLNQKEIALRYCKNRGLDYKKVNLLICHIGGGISVTAHKEGRMIDSNDIIGGDGPMTPTRAGSLATVKVLKMCFSGEYTEKQLYNRLSKEGGLIDHLGTADGREIEKMIEEGNTYAKKVYDAMIYQIAKYAGECACALKGKVDVIILTGGLSNSKYLTGKLTEYIEWISDVCIMPGEFEMEALAAGALRVERGEEKALLYTGEAVWKGFE